MKALETLFSYCRILILILSLLQITGCSVDEVPLPTAEFSFSSENNFLEQTLVSFKNESLNGKEFTWDFGDNSVSTVINPTHTYQSSGKYKVVLIASNGDKISQIAKDVNIIGNPVADFDFVSSNNFLAPSSVTFTNKSKNAASYSWDFGDGSASSEKDPVHIYLNSGNYIVSLKAVNFSVQNLKSQTIIIKSIQASQLEKLSKTWKATSAKKDGVDQTGYANFTLTLSGTVGATSFGYATTGRPALSAWLSSGNWTFDTNLLIGMIRDQGTSDELKMTYVVTETTLQITFTFTGSGYGRVESVKGQWVMTFGL